MLDPETPALVLAPMDGITDAAMRAFQGSTGAFTYAVSEFIRVSIEPIPYKVFRRDVPELASGSLTCSGMPVQVQILGGDPVRMAKSAHTAWRAGAKSIDINFGCPAPTVNRNDGGASLLLHPCRIRDIVKAVRSALPTEVPVSAKLRLGWDTTDAIFENAEMATAGGAAWLTIHARTRTQGYAPPVFFPPIRRVRERLGIPVIANGDIWNMDDFRRCQEETGCNHFMIGRGALADPVLPHRIASSLGLNSGQVIDVNWVRLFRRFSEYSISQEGGSSVKSHLRLKQWASIAHKFGDFPFFNELKLTKTLDEFFDRLNKQNAVFSREQSRQK